MNLVKLANFFETQSEQNQLIFICKLAHQITILARSTYVAGTDHISDPQFLRWLNEIQHLLLGQACHLARRDPHRYSDDIFCRMILDRTEHPDYGSGFENMFTTVLSAAHA